MKFNNRNSIRKFGIRKIPISNNLHSWYDNDKKIISNRLQILEVKFKDPWMDV